MIRGKTVLLRAIESSDLDLYHSWINDEETNQWRGLSHPTSREDADLWIRERRKSGPDHLSLAIEHATDGLIGFIGLRGICPRSRRAEIWIYIGSKLHWNQGIGFDAITAICDYAFEEMNLFRIWLECNPEFVPVVRCYEKVGFLHEGLLRKAYYRNGQFRDTCIMGLLREDWEKTHREKTRV